MERPERKIRNDHEAAIWDYIDHQEGIINELVEFLERMKESVPFNENFEIANILVTPDGLKQITELLQKAKEAIK